MEKLLMYENGRFREVPDKTLLEIGLPPKSGEAYRISQFPPLSTVEKISTNMAGIKREVNLVVVGNRILYELSEQKTPEFVLKKLGVKRKAESKYMGEKIPSSL